MAIQLSVQENKLAEIFKDHDKIIAVYLFGSRVNGNTDKFSDYDFAVLFDESQKDRWNTVGDLLCKAFSVVGQDKADVVDLSNQPLWFQQVVVKSGKIIYETSENKRLFYERELVIKCLEEGVSEYVEDGRMRKQDVQINFETIEENLKMLEYLKRFNFSEFTSDFRNVQSALHLLQTSIEALADISRYVIRSLGLPTAEEYWQIPMILSDAGYIDPNDAEIYVQMVRFRNLVVHHYYKANPEEIYKILTENLSDIQCWRDILLEIIEGKQV
jgi:uncharacterized protein YutE (UPF0331/DUF86 family)/predicted nucleotidyltransferase